MPFGQPVPIPTEKRPCGCVVQTYGGGRETVLSWCPTHLEELPEAEREQIRRERRQGMVYDATTLLIRLAFVVVLGYMGWTIWRGLRGG